MEIVSALQLAATREVLLPATHSELPNCLIGDNFDKLPDPILAEARATVYSARSITHPAVELVGYPPGTRLFGGWHFLIESGGLAADDQVPPPNVLADRNDVNKLAAEPAERITVDDPCVMVSRFGVMVWGHWLGELLPRILLTERTFPGRFKYVLPLHVFNSSSPRNVWNSIGDTIRLLGIDRSRILQARPDRHYVFSKLHGVTSVITDFAFHPGALEQIRSAYLDQNTPNKGRKIAVLRTESKARNISNLGDVIAPLRRRDYEFVEVGTLPFQEQIHLFSTATKVVGVLASGLTGLLFSPDHVHVLSVAPKGYINKFFYPIMQSRFASYYDVRGHIAERDPRSDVFSNFHVPVEDLERGLDRLERSGA